MRWNRLWLTRWLAEDDNPMFYTGWPSAAREREAIQPPGAVLLDSSLRWNDGGGRITNFRLIILSRRIYVNAIHLLKSLAIPSAHLEADQSFQRRLESSG